MIGLTGLGKQRAPHVLGAAEHARDEVARFVVGGQRSALLAARRHTATAAEQLHDGFRTAQDEGEPEDDQYTDPAADTAAAAPQRHTPAAARPAHVADVAAPP